MFSKSKVSLQTCFPRVQVHLLITNKIQCSLLQIILTTLNLLRWGKLCRLGSTNSRYRKHKGMVVPNLYWLEAGEGNIWWTHPLLKYLSFLLLELRLSSHKASNSNNHLFNKTRIKICLSLVKITLRVITSRSQHKAVPQSNSPREESDFSIGLLRNMKTSFTKRRLALPQLKRELKKFTMRTSSLSTKSISLKIILRLKRLKISF